MSNNDKLNSKVKEFSNDQDWLEARKKIITATEMPCLLGLDKYKSAEKMYKEKSERTFFGNAYTTVGQLLEPVVVDATNLFIDTDFQLYDQQAHKVMFIDEEIGIGATPDASSESLEALLECKTTLPHNYELWRYEPPIKYLVQLHTQLICTGVDTGYLSIMSTNLAQSSPKLDFPISIFKIKYDNIVKNHILKEIKRFWATREENKVFRSNRKEAKLLELHIRIHTEKIL